MTAKEIIKEQGEIIDELYGSLLDSLIHYCIFAEKLQGQELLAILRKVSELSLVADHCKNRCAVAKEAFENLGIPIVTEEELGESND